MKSSPLMLFWVKANLNQAAANRRCDETNECLSKVMLSSFSIAHL
jgi:hypothetical protein